jgi:hypothetical protein
MKDGRRRRGTVILVGQQPIMRCLSEQIGEALVVVVVEVVAVEFLVGVWRAGRI